MKRKMKVYVDDVPDAIKLKRLQEHAMGVQWTSLDQLKWCLHCRKQFSGRSVRVYTDADPGLWLECGNPSCTGSPIDWADYPWWDENHPQTQIQDALDEERSGEASENN